MYLWLIEISPFFTSISFGMMCDKMLENGSEALDLAALLEILSCSAGKYHGKVYY